LDYEIIRLNYVNHGYLLVKVVIIQIKPLFYDLENGYYSLKSSNLYSYNLLLHYLLIGYEKCCRVNEKVKLLLEKKDLFYLFIWK